MTTPKKPATRSRRKPLTHQELLLDVVAPEAAVPTVTANGAPAAEASAEPVKKRASKAKAKSKVSVATTLSPKPKPAPETEPSAKSRRGKVAQEPPLRLSQPAPEPEPAPEPAPEPETEPLARSRPGEVAQEPPRRLSQPEPAPKPAPAPEPGFRYYRRPPPEPAERPAPRTPPPPVAAWRQRPLDATEAKPAPASSGPRQLDMAELAARRRQTQAVERAAEAPATPTRAPLDLQQRAARYTKPVDEPPPQRAEQPMARRAAQHDDSIARAAEATRHKRLAEPVLAAPMQPPPATVSAPAALRSVAVVLVTRNHEALVADRLAAWRALLGRSDLRLAVLDLGSSDDTAERAQAHPGVTLIVVPGGLVAPAAAVAAALQQVPAEDVLFADASAEPDLIAEALWQALRSGAALAIAPRVEPQLLAVDATKLRGQKLQLAKDLLVWSQNQGGLVRFGAEQGPADRWGFAAACVRLPVADRLQAAAARLVAQVRARVAL